MRVWGCEGVAVCDWGSGRKRERECAWRHASYNLVNVGCTACTYTVYIIMCEVVEVCLGEGVRVWRCAWGRV